MLQQTRVDSVIEYFRRFMERYPTPRDLAESDLDELMGYWAGLGYYARARNLHAAACQVVEKHGGQVPDDPEAFAALKGVGRYTCGAVQSIAYGRALPVVDGNVIRVLSRLERIADNPKDAQVLKKFWARAEEELDILRPGDFNQGIMELGAMVCSPRNPKCEQCPLSDRCSAYSVGDPEVFPTKVTRKARAREHRVAAFIQDEQGRVCLGRRPTSVLLGGLWALPSIASQSANDLRTIGLQAGELLAQIEHAFTHKVWTVSVVAARGKPTGGEYEKYAYFSVEEMNALGLTGPSLKALRQIGIKIRHRRGAGKKKGEPTTSV